jgi:hypothetical protein
MGVEKMNSSQKWLVVGAFAILFVANIGDRYSRSGADNKLEARIVALEAANSSLVAEALIGSMRQAIQSADSAHDIMFELSYWPSLYKEHLSALSDEDAFRVCSAKWTFIGELRRQHPLAGAYGELVFEPRSRPDIAMQCEGALSDYLNSPVDDGVWMYSMRWPSLFESSVGSIPSIDDRCDLGIKERLHERVEKVKNNQVVRDFVGGDDGLALALLDRGKKFCVTWGRRID